MWASKLALYTRVAILYNRSPNRFLSATPPILYDPALSKVATNAGSNSDILTLATPGFCSFLISCTNLFVPRISISRPPSSQLNGLLMNVAC